jgi:hypothetical protein
MLTGVCLSCLVLSDQGGKTLGIIGLGLYLSIYLSIYLSLQTHKKTFLTKSKRPRFSPRQQTEDIAWVETQRVIYVMLCCILCAGRIGQTFAAKAQAAFKMKIVITTTTRQIIDRPAAFRLLLVSFRFPPRVFGLVILCFGLKCMLGLRGFL